MAIGDLTFKVLILLLLVGLLLGFSVFLLLKLDLRESWSSALLVRLISNLFESLRCQG